MNSRILIAAIATGLALSACAAMQPGQPVGPPSGCSPTGAECAVYVDVSDCTHVAFDPDALDVKDGARVIHWRIRQGLGTYRFAPSGIIIKDTYPGQEFNGGRPVESDNGYLLNDKNSIPGKHIYRYGVDLMHGSQACPRFDPTIVNQR
ncbi:MAG TPA: hypothetical protein VKT00_07485 [Casimicrobiaceae bacterium]|nr:hypothetical protein [Casimicrobiaceae bacterium]